MAGYVLYSLDWGRFQSLVNNPTHKQLLKFAELISDSLDEHDGEFEDGDPVHDWPSEPLALCDLVKDRLARPDWYGELSNAGKDIWCSAVFRFCSSTDRNAVGFRVEHDGIYWSVLELARKPLKLPPNRFSPDVALSAFGERITVIILPRTSRPIYSIGVRCTACTRPTTCGRCWRSLDRSGRRSRTRPTSRLSATTTL